ncbi:uncharacterized protein [Paramisgurnus dabryanus]|uniref:uncharacterized protein n=1 Tax=Paramisgurnus dabryanus TaxID=90735 RepID=UPI003CCF74A0
MKFQILLLTCAVLIATDVYGEAQPQQGDSDKSMSLQQGRPCNCIERRNGQKQNCPCSLPSQRTILSEKQRDLCKKKGIKTFKKCKQLIPQNIKNGKKSNKAMGTPF